MLSLIYAMEMEISVNGKILILLTEKKKIRKMKTKWKKN